MSDIFQTKDRNIIKMLKACRCIPVSIENNHGELTFGYSKEDKDVSETLEKWVQGKEISVDVREWIIADAWFISVLRSNDLSCFAKTG